MAGQEQTGHQQEGRRVPRQPEGKETLAKYRASPTGEEAVKRADANQKLKHQIAAATARCDLEEGLTPAGELVLFTALCDDPHLGYYFGLDDHFMSEYEDRMTPAEQRTFTARSLTA